MVNNSFLFPFVIGRQIALQKKLEPARATSLALSGSLLGSMSNQPLIGTIFTHQRAQREAPVENKPVKTPDRTGGFTSFQAASPEQQLEKVAERLKRVIDAAAARATAAAAAARAAAEASQKAQEEYTETVKQAQAQFARISAEIEKLFDARNRSFTEKFTGVKDAVGKLLDDAQGNADKVGVPEAADSGKYARTIGREGAKKSKADELIRPQS